MSVHTVNGPEERAAAVYPRGAVAHEHPAATEAGVAMLRAGGNAVDAAVAVGFAACVTMPAWTTIGGSGFMLIAPGDGADPVAVEFPPRAPLGARPDMFALDHDKARTAIIGVSAVVDDANVKGALSVGVPGVVAGLCAAQERFGRLPLADVLAPSIELARDGFDTYPELLINTLEVLPDLRAAGPAVRGTFLTADGDPPAMASASGLPSRVCQRELAVTLEAIARDGAAGFYRGAPGQAIVAEVRSRGGVLSCEDLERAQALVTAPLSMRVGQATVWAPTSPNGGWTELQILGLLARLDGMLDDTSRFDLCAFVEASRRCFADRFHFMGDPAQVEVPLDLLLGDDYLDALAADVAAALAGDPSRRSDYPAGLPWHHYAARVPAAFTRLCPDRLPTSWQDRERVGAGLNDSFQTTHLSTVDENRMAVSCTLTAAHTFGSRLVAAGVLLDDAMVWFNAAPGAANSIAPGKRPLCNMGPLIIRHDDGRTLALGAPGGRRILSAVTQVAAHWLRGEDLQHATAQPRVDGSSSSILIPLRLDQQQTNTLRAAGHTLQPVEDRNRFCIDFARPVAIATTHDGQREAAVQPYVRASVGGI